MKDALRLRSDRIGPDDGVDLPKRPAVGAEVPGCGRLGRGGISSMKPIPISLSPTRNRALNVFLGAVLTLSSILLLVALATYHPSDPSMNTATAPEPGNAVHNWIGLLGAYISDIL